jgi:lipopolysaccharide biosynthesis glycosyltransferase
LAGQWGELSPSWNWQISPNNFSILQDYNPRVIHFTGEEKPWNDRYGLYMPALRAFADFMVAKGHSDKANKVVTAVKDLAFPSQRRSERIAHWTGEKQLKFSRMDRYLERRDFIDTAQGLPLFATTPSKFGHSPMPINSC